MFSCSLAQKFVGWENVPNFFGVISKLLFLEIKHTYCLPKQCIRIVIVALSTKEQKFLSPMTSRNGNLVTHLVLNTVAHYSCERLECR